MSTTRTRNPGQIAEILTVDEKTVRRWCSRKSLPCPHTRLPSGELRLDEAEVAGWMRDQQLTGRPGRPARRAGGSGGGGDADDDPRATLDGARLRKENALADRYELDLAERMGELVDAEEATARWTAVGQVVRTGFQSLPAQLAPVALRHGMPPAAAAAFSAECGALVDAILAHLSTDLAAGADAGDDEDEQPHDADGPGPA